jgi:glycosyltransferase involved in cell wall biosynthesis
MVENLFVVMPAYNAGETIEKVFARIPKEALGRIRRYVVVNDGSTDDTKKALTRIASDFPNLDILDHRRNLGYGAAEKTLLRHAVREGAEAALLLHSDGQYSPESIPDLLGPLDRKEADLVQGSRMIERGGALRGGMPLYKYVANRCLTAIENKGFGMKMAEYHSGYMLYSRELLLAVPFEKFSNSFDFDLEMIVAAGSLGLKIKQIPIPTIYGEEVSYLNPFKYGIDVLKVVMRYRKGYYHDLLEVPRK